VLVRCVYVRLVWFSCLGREGLDLSEPQFRSTLEAWWTDQRQRVSNADRRKFDTLVIATTWLLWKQRNVRVFQNIRDLCDVTDLIDRIHDEFMIWMSVRAGGRQNLVREVD
jgi:hypothetical protein